MIYFFYFFAMGVFGSMLSVYLGGMGKRSTEISLIVSASGIFTMALQPLIGFIYTGGERIVNMLMQPTCTIMDASATFVGQNWGANKYAHIREGLKRVMVMEVLWGIAACAVVYLMGGAIISYTTGTQSEEIVVLAVNHMRVVLPFFPVLGILLVLRTAMQGMGQKLAPVLSSGLELIGAMWMISDFGFGGIGVNIAITWSVMTAYLGIVYWVRTRRRLIELDLNDRRLQSGIYLRKEALSWIG